MECKATERKLIALMRAHGIGGWRRGASLRLKVERRKLKAVIRTRPDFVFPRERLAVFVDGCFWHGCPIHATWPKNNAAFWEAKILGNRKRDRAVTRELKRRGWRVLRIWEHALARKHEARTVGRLRRALGGNNAARIPEPGV